MHANVIYCQGSPFSCICISDVSNERCEPRGTDMRKSCRPSTAGIRINKKTCFRAAGHVLACANHTLNLSVVLTNRIGRKSGCHAGSPPVPHAISRPRYHVVFYPPFDRG